MKIPFYKSITLRVLKYSILTALLLFISGAASFSQTREHGVNVGLFYPLSTHGTSAGEYSNFFSVNGIMGISRAEKGFTVAGISNIIHEGASGFQVAGISNHIGGFSEGFKAAGIVNIYQNATGFQAAGITNIAKNVTGMQAAGIMNESADLHGFQAAGILNISQRVRGTQVAGYINMADDVDGIQISSFLNIAKKVKGVQISGFINIADSSDYPIGIINIIKNGEKAIGVTTDDNLTTLIAFRSGGKKLYGIIGMGYNFQNAKDVFAMQYGIGAHLITKNNFRLNAEAATISLDNFKRGEFGKFSVSLLPAVKFGKKIEVFGGPSFSFVNTNTEEGKKLINHYLWNDTNRHDRLNGFYIGYSAGVHLIL